MGWPALRVWLLGVLLAACWAAGPARADGPPPIRLGLSVLKVEAKRAQGGFALGSAVVVAPGELVTNCHVTREATQLHVMYIGQRWQVASQAADIEHDLCLLRVPGLAALAVDLGSSHDLRPGQRVNAVGYTGGQALQATGGQVVALHRLDGGHVVQSSNWFTSGASGGALFDERQRLVGVLTFRMPGAEGHYFAAPTEWIAALQARTAEAVAPLDARPLAYWQQQGEQQPRFLRALRLWRDAQWSALRHLAADWLTGDDKDPEPWYLAGVALDKLGRAADAQGALRCAMLLEPAFQAAEQLLATLAGATFSGDPGGRPTTPTSAGRCAAENLR